MLTPLKPPITIYQRCDTSDCQVSKQKTMEETGLMYIWVDYKRVELLNSGNLKSPNHLIMFLQSQPLYTHIQKLLMDTIVRLFRIQIFFVLNSARNKLNY